MAKLSGSGSLYCKVLASTMSMIYSRMIATTGVISIIPMLGMILCSGPRMGSVI